MYECPRCQYCCDTKYIFLQHLSKKYICSTILSDILIENINIEDCKKKIYSYKCQYCNELFTMKNSLKRHQSVICKGIIIKDGKDIKDYKNSFEQLKETVDKLDKKLQEQSKENDIYKEQLKEKDKKIRELEIKKSSSLTLHNFCSKLSKYNNNIKGEVFENTVKFIIQNHKEFSNIKNVWLYSEIPENIKLKYNMPKQDKGIDILIENENNLYIPVQCKFTSSNKNITYADLSTFVAQVFAMNLNLCYLFTNSYKIDNFTDKIKKYDGNFFEILGKEYYEL